MATWGVGQVWSFDMAAVGSRDDGQGVIAEFADERTRSLYELSEMEVDLMERLGIRISLLSSLAVENLEDEWRRKSIPATMRPLVLKTSHAA